MNDFRFFSWPISWVQSVLLILVPPTPIYAAKDAWAILFPVIPECLGTQYRVNLILYASTSSSARHSNCSPWCQFGFLMPKMLPIRLGLSSLHIAELRILPLAGVLKKWVAISTSTRTVYSSSHFRFTTRLDTRYSDVLGMTVLQCHYK